MNLQTGAFGDPKQTETLILFWGKMEMLHYPGAGETKKYLEDRLQREQVQNLQAMLTQTRMQGTEPGAGLLQAAQAPAGAANTVSAAMQGGGYKDL